MYKSLLFFLFLAQSLFGGILPEINPQDVSETLEQIMEAHVFHKQLTKELVARGLKKYLEELDPTKTYFLEKEVMPWLKPTEERLETILTSIEKSDFLPFSTIHEKMIQAISRRNSLEKELKTAELPKDVSVNEFKDLNWAKNTQELSQRLLRIKALQAFAAEKLDPALKEKALQRIAKRRGLKEEDILRKDPIERERYILANALKALASAFDTHTAYFTPGEAALFMIQVQQRLFGIGVQLRDDLNGFTIVKIIDGGPASRNTGLQVNDRVIAINNEPVVGMEIMDAVELIRGEEGTSITLSVLRETSEKVEKKFDIEITRGEVVIKEARIESSIEPFADGVIAHIALHAFYQDPLHSSASDLYEEISKIKKNHKIKGIILDLRHNSGGVLPQAVAVTGLFITKGIIVSIKDNKGVIEHLRNIDGKTVWDGPLVILTSKASASAAEIVAQTLQDYGRAIVVGDEHTYGKGTFQTFTLDTSHNKKINPKGEFKVTRGRYYTVSGKSPQLVGVKPNIIVPGALSTMDIGERHANFPLENDFIAENFHDDLSDIPVVQRDHISWLYRFNLQPRLKCYTRLLPVLRKNSEERISKNKLYQDFLGFLDQQEEVNIDVLELFVHGDPQFNESVNVIKDLIVLLK